MTGTPIAAEPQLGLVAFLGVLAVTTLRELAAPYRLLRTHPSRPVCGLTSDHGLDARKDRK